MVLIMLLRADFLVQIVSVSIRAKALRGPVSRSSRPQPPSLSPKESNTYDDVAVNQSNDVFKVKTAEGSDETPSRSLTGRKRKTEVTSTSPTNKEEKQYTPNDQSTKTPNLSVTTQYEQTYEKCVYVLSVSDGEATSFRCH